MKFRVEYRPVGCLNAGFDLIFPCADKVEKSGVHMASQLCLHQRWAVNICDL
jgi:hypothetical protein